jgi:hypothetical protein
MAGEQTLAARVRAKHPGAYDDLTDEQLEAAVTAKFPGVYDDLPRSTVAATAPPPMASRPPAEPAKAPAGAAPARSWWDELVAMVDQRNQLERGVAQHHADMVTGIAKGAANTAVGLGELVHQVPGVSAGVDTLYGTKGVSEAAFPAARAAVQPDNAAENAGFITEQIGEFFLLPSSKGTVLVRAAKEGVKNAAVAAAQGGDPVSAGVAATAGPVLGAPAGRLSTALRESAEKRVTQALGATKERFKAMSAKLAPEMLDRGVPGAMGASRRGLLEQAQAKAGEYGKAIDEAIQGAAGERIGTKPIIDALEELKGDFSITRQMTVKEAIAQGIDLTTVRRGAGGMVDVPIVLDQRPIQQLTSLQQTLTQLGDEATVEHLVAVRRAWDEVVSQAGGYQHRAGGAIGQPLADRTEAWAKREGAGAIRRVLAEEVPNLAALNKEYAFWRGIRDVLRQTGDRTQPQSGRLTRAVAGGAGATVGAAAGAAMGGPLGAAVGGGIGQQAGKYLEQVVTSPRWRLVSANMRNQLAEALASGSHAQTMSALGKVYASVVGGGALRRPEMVPAH